MKIKIKMRRGHGSSWCGSIKKRVVTACPSEVTTLFAMGSARSVTCEISNVRPRGHDDYHVFAIMSNSQYRVTDVTIGFMPCITTRTSRIIRDAFVEEKQAHTPIYVSFY